MARVLETLVTQSVLDRLMTWDEWPATRKESVRFVRKVLLRDLEWLLNTRQPPIEGLGRYSAARKSVLNYGLMDATALSLASSTDRRRLKQAVEECIAHFEPRLTNVQVTLVEGDMKHRQLRFHIEGQIRIDPAPEEIAFDTTLDLTSGEYTVS